MEIKQCTNCKEYKNIAIFLIEISPSKKGKSKKLLSIRKEYNNLKSRDYYYKINANILTMSIDFLTKMKKFFT